MIYTEGNGENEDEDISIYEFGLQVAMAGGLRALVAGESGVGATALPPQSKFAKGWRWLAPGGARLEI